jgi:tRNA threonylcarbamoyladenosine biosynthesis protein TsaE
MLSYTTHSAAETQALARAVGGHLKKGDCIAFFGGLGAGKTTFTRGLAEGLGLPDLVSSPTFALVNEYCAPDCIPVYHFDMYRVHSPEALETTGFWDYPAGEGVFVIEWAENIEAQLPANAIRITITGNGDDTRTITIEGDDSLADIIG